MSEIQPSITAGGAADVTQDEKVMAAVAHASAGLLGLALVGIGIPVILYFAYKDRSRYVMFHALQALVFQFAAASAIYIITFVTCGFGLFVTAPLGLAVVVLQLYYAWQAYEGAWKPYPLLEQLKP